MARGDECNPLPPHRLHRPAQPAAQNKGAAAMERFWSALVIVVMMLVPTLAVAGPAEDPGKTVERWATAFNGNDVNALIDLYLPDATFFGTVGQTAKEGNEAIRGYYSRLANSGDRVTIGDHKTIALDDNAAYVIGEYEFSALRNGQRQTAVARFTMLLVKRDHGWLIAHHHSSHPLDRIPLRSRRALQSEHQLASTPPPTGELRMLASRSREAR
jgi:uncharacterized protein (TIGR02246 family)